MSALRRLKSACPSVHTDQGLHCPYEFPQLFCKGLMNRQLVSRYWIHLEYFVYCRIVGQVTKKRDFLLGPQADRTYICNLELGATLELRVMFHASKTGLSTPWPAPHPHPTSVFLLTIPRRFLCCSSSLFVRLWFHMWRLCRPYLFLICLSFGASGGLCFVIVAFPGYRHLYFLICPYTTQVK